MRLPSAIILCLVLLHCFGCASSGARRETTDRTGGMTLRMTVYDTYARWMYDVQSDGMLSYAGGQDVTNQRFSWTGAMSDEEIAELRELVQRHGWVGGRRSEGTGEGSRRYVVHVKQDTGGTRRFEVRGDRADAAEVNQLLHRVALRRLEPELEAMPRPGPLPR